MRDGRRSRNCAADTLAFASDGSLSSDGRTTSLELSDGRRTPSFSLRLPVNEVPNSFDLFRASLIASPNSSCKTHLARALVRPSKEKVNLGGEGSNIHE